MTLDDTGWRQPFRVSSSPCSGDRHPERALRPDPWIAAGTSLVLSDNHLDIKEADFDEKSTYKVNRVSGNLLWRRF